MYTVVPEDSRAALGRRYITGRQLLFRSLRPHRDTNRSSTRSCEWGRYYSARAGNNSDFLQPLTAASVAPDSRSRYRGILGFALGELAATQGVEPRSRSHHKTEGGVPVQDPGWAFCQKEAAKTFYQSWNFHFLFLTHLFFFFSVIRSVTCRENISLQDK